MIAAVKNSYKKFWALKLMDRTSRGLFQQIYRGQAAICNMR